MVREFDAIVLLAKMMAVTKERRSWAFEKVFLRVKGDDVGNSLGRSVVFSFLTSNDDDDDIETTATTATDERGSIQSSYTAADEVILLNTHHIAKHAHRVIRL